jgi:hypothetical protein
LRNMIYIDIDKANKRIEELESILRAITHPAALRRLLKLAESALKKGEEA